MAMDSLCLMLHCGELGGQFTGDLCLLPVLLMHRRGLNLIDSLFQLANSVISVHGVIFPHGLLDPMRLALHPLLDPGRNDINLLTPELLTNGWTADF